MGNKLVNKHLQSYEQTYWPVLKAMKSQRISFAEIY